MTTSTSVSVMLDSRDPPRIASAKPAEGASLSLSSGGSVLVHLYAPVRSVAEAEAILAWMEELGAELDRVVSHVRELLAAKEAEGEDPEALSPDGAGSKVQAYRG